LVLGEDPSHIFVVKIPETESVSTLREIIKEKKRPAFDHIPADSLVLRKVSIPVDANLKEYFQTGVFDDEPLSPVTRLLKIFGEHLEDDHLHIVVKVPPTGECLYHMYNIVYAYNHPFSPLHPYLLVISCSTAIRIFIIFPQLWPPPVSSSTAQTIECPCVNRTSSEILQECLHVSGAHLHRLIKISPMPDWIG
jgi:hypothetical protein